MCDPRTPIARGIEGRRLQTRIEPNIEMQAKAFLACGVDPDYRSLVGLADGRTALMLTPQLASEGFDDAEALALLLIKCGADVDAIDKLRSAWTPRRSASPRAASACLPISSK